MILATVIILSVTRPRIITLRGSLRIAALNSNFRFGPA